MYIIILTIFYFAQTSSAGLSSSRTLRCPQCAPLSKCRGTVSSSWQQVRRAASSDDVSCHSRPSLYLCFSIHFRHVQTQDPLLWHLPVVAEVWALFGFRWWVSRRTHLLCGTRVVYSWMWHSFSFLLPSLSKLWLLTSCLMTTRR